MKNFWLSIRSFLRSLPYFVLFELVYKLMILALALPLLEKVLRFTLKITGVNYLSGENMFVYLRHPFTLIVVLLLLFFTAFFSFIELASLAASFSCAVNKKRISVGGMFTEGLKAFLKAFRRTGILKFAGFMLMMPFVQLTVSSGIFLTPVKPFLQALCKNIGITANAAAGAYFLLLLLFIMLFIGHSYLFHFLVLTDNSFTECEKKSKGMVRKNRLKMMFSFALWILFVLAATSLIVLTVSFVIVLFIKGFSSPDKAFRTALNVLRYALNVIAVISTFFTPPMLMCWLTSRFFSEVGEDEKIVLPVGRSMLGKPVKAALIVTSLAVSTWLNLSYIKALRRGDLRMMTGLVTRTQVTAHRGFSGAAPENTYYAFEKAMECNADFIELDVQMTADNQLVVFHDDTLDRTTDGKGKLSSMTYDELLQLSAGSWFGDEYADARIMLLSEVLDLVGDDIMLNIEIKSRGNVKSAADETVRLVQEYDIEDSCYVSSFSYSALKRVKKQDPDIKTALIANVDTAASYSQLMYINAVSMNYLFVNRSVVDSAHQNGKQIFVWTVDRKDSMQDMIDLGVDNIITNVPDKALETVYSQSIGDNVLGVLKKIFR